MIHRAISPRARFAAKLMSLSSPLRVSLNAGLTTVPFSTSGLTALKYSFDARFTSTLLRVAAIASLSCSVMASPQYS